MPPKPKLLVIEDEEAIINIMQLNFELEGFEVFGCSKSLESLRECLLELPDVIILDLLMPEESGWEVLRELKSNPVTRDIPVIICSVIKQEEKERTIQMGASAYVTKPFEIRELIEMAERLIGWKVNSSN